MYASMLEWLKNSFPVQTSKIVTEIKPLVFSFVEYRILTQTAASAALWNPFVIRFVHIAIIFLRDCPRLSKHKPLLNNWLAGWLAHTTLARTTCFPRCLVDVTFLLFVLECFRCFSCYSFLPLLTTIAGRHRIKPLNSLMLLNMKAQQQREQIFLVKTVNKHCMM